VLGCLVEKQLTTPQQYPLTLNALTMATNQATNRDPVVDLDDETVSAAIDELRGQHLVRVLLPSHGRSVKRYRHVVDEVYGLDATRYALLATLLLRGAQTVGELRARSERMVDVPSIGDVQEQLNVLAEHSEGLVRLLPRRPGQKEDRWQQTLAAPWNSEAGHTGADGTESAQIDATPPEETAGNAGALGAEGRSAPDSSGGPAPLSDTDQWSAFETLRSDVASLRDEVAALHQELDALRQGLGG
jgi:uncharacterized protein YceH (UPF0502 family)